MSEDEQTPEERLLERTLRAICEADVTVLGIKNREYGGSWKKRGGTGAFMMLARKWDRLEEQVRKLQWDVFTAALNDSRKEGVIDDIGDLRRYLLLVESEVMNLRALAADPWTEMADNYAIAVCARCLSADHHVSDCEEKDPNGEQT